MGKLNNKQETTQKSESEFKDITENGGIGLHFTGKANSLRIIRKVKPRILKEIPKLSISSKERKSQNLVIEGDNLMSMATLYQYHGKIDLIITDPPYNTGEDFRYNDCWDQDPNDPGLGDYVKIDDPSKHTKWLKFMVPRLQVIKRMLKPSGILAICIDERELSRLLPLLDDSKVMFGEENRIAIITWEKATPKNDAKHISNITEYVLVYAKKEKGVNTKRLERPEELNKKYKNPDGDLAGAWVVGDPSAKRNIFSSVYAIQNPFTGCLLLPSSGASWRWQKQKMKGWLEEYGSKYVECDLQDNKAPALILQGTNNYENIEDNPVVEKAKVLAEKKLKKGNWPRLVFSQAGQGRIGIKRYLNEVREGVVSTSYWEWEKLGSVSLRSEESGLTTHGTKEIIERVGEKFVGAKPLKLFQKIIQLWCPLGGLVCDPFAGTGTTGEAVLKLNKELKAERERERERERANSTDTTKSLNKDKFERQFILIEQGFNTKEEDKKENNYCRTLLQKRLQAVITGQWADKKEHEPLGGGFKFFQLTKKVDSHTILKMEKQELVETILSSNLNHTSLLNNTYLIAENKQNEGIYLIWNANNEKVESKITEEVYYQCALERKKYGLTPIYHIYARSTTYQSSTIIFHKIPDKVLIDFGIDPDTDTFINEEEK